MKKILLLVFLSFCLCSFSQPNLAISQPNIRWSQIIGGGVSCSNAISDNSGNIIISGDFYGSVNFPSISSAVITLTTTQSSQFIAKYNSIGNCLWAKQIGFGGSFLENKITIDQLGNIYMTGGFYGVIDFDPGILVNSLTSSGTHNIFLAKYDNNGDYLWARNIGSGTDGYGRAVKVDLSGDVVISGYFDNQADFDPTSSSFMLYGTGFSGFLCKYNSSGSFIWATGLNSVSGSSYDLGTSLDFDGLGNIYVASMSFAIQKYDINGVFLWTKGGGGGVSHVNSIELDGSGNIYFSGYFSGTVDFDPGSTTAYLTSSGLRDNYLVKYDSNGDYIWARSLGLTNLDAPTSSYGNAILIDAGNNVYVTGSFTGMVDFDPGPLVTNLASAGPSDVFLAKYDNNGNYLWATNNGSSNIDSGTSLSLDLAGNLYTWSNYNSGAYLYLAKYCVETPTLNATISGNTLVCPNTIHTYSIPAVPGITNYQWTLPFGWMGYSLSNTISGMSNTNGGTIYVVTTNTCGSSLPMEINITSSNTPPTISISNTILCTGTSVDLIASGANTYSWSTGALTPTINVMPNGSTTYTVMGKDINNCINTSQSFTVTESNICSYVWPGDANSDGVADNLDVLELGIHYGSGGSPRSVIANSWQPYYSYIWYATISNGQNLNHSDCNGDGLIDANDTLAIYLNYGLTHAFKSSQQTSTNEQLTIVPDQPMVNKGQWGTASVYLGSSTSPINTINGLAFTLHFDQSLIEPNSMQIDYPVSFLNTGQNLNFRKQDDANGALYAATTHTNNSNINGGYGKIAVIHYQIKSSLVHDTVLAFNLVQATQSSANGSLIPLTSGSASVTAIGASVGINELSDNDMVAIYPNPAKSVITIITTSELQRVELVSVTGQVIIIESASGNEHQLDVSSVSNGVYAVMLYGKNDSIQQKKIVVYN